MYREKQADRGEEVEEVKRDKVKQVKKSSSLT
jgi:hypothetical protein